MDEILPKNTARFVRRAFGFVIAATLFAPAFAALGEKSATIAADAKALGATLKPAITKSMYKSYEMVSGGGTVIEFVSADDIVFAITWRGRQHPNLNPLLGKYFDEFQAATAQAVALPGRRNRAIAGPRVTVEQWGQMRDLQGRAYDANLVPGGIAINDLQ